MKYLLLVLALISFQADAQTWPNKPVRIIVPYPPGGQTDIITRWLGDKLAPVLGQPVLAENRAGAQGIVGLEAAKNAAPDGYTFVYSNVSNISLNPHMYEKLPYDGQKDFAPVTQLGLSVLAMVVPSSLGPKSLKEFVAWAKASPGKVSYASFGNGSSSHVYGEMLKGAAGFDMVHVPYRGAGPAVQDIIAGHASTGIHDLASVGPHVASGKLVALAVTGPKRWPALPDLPTFAEQGYPLDVAGWNGIMAPAGTSAAIVERMSAEINRIIQSAEGREQILKYGLLVTGTTPAEFADIIRRDTPRWGEVIRKAGIRSQQ
ncbi:MAG: tripartite tricarboxylate transporter substrate binding protein [Burkholderiales bacterium]